MKIKKRFQVKLYNGKSPNHMRWQVKDLKNYGTCEYYKSDICSIEMTNCTLKKGNCQGWVDCDMVDVNYIKNPKFVAPNIKNMYKYSYDPKKSDYWFTRRNSNEDNRELHKMHTHKKSLYGKVLKVHPKHI